MNTPVKQEWASGAEMVWHFAGQPPHATLGIPTEPGLCAMCGLRSEETWSSKIGLGPNFSDQYELHRSESDRMCYVCVWSCSGKPPATLRAWTVLAREDMVLPESNPKAPYRSPHLFLTALDDMRPVVATLANPPEGQWLVSVAESSQKHHVPHSRVNRGAREWTVRMDAVNVTATPHQFRTVLRHVLRLREAKFSVKEIEAVAPNRLTADTIPIWREHGEALTPWRQGPLLHLTAFLPKKKEHMDEYISLYG